MKRYPERTDIKDRQRALGLRDRDVAEQAGIDHVLWRLVVNGHKLLRGRDEAVRVGGVLGIDPDTLPYRQVEKNVPLPSA